MAEQLTCNQQVVGSTPTWSSTRPLGQAVKTPPFHGGNRGSIPLGVTINIWKHSSAGRASALQAEGHRFDPCCFHQISFIGSMAEQLTCNQQVVGSTPTWSSKYGGVPERPKGADCKSVTFRFDGSNPSSPTISMVYTMLFLFYKK